jgi:hypothetical protein
MSGEQRSLEGGGWESKLLQGPWSEKMEGPQGIWSLK